MVKSQTNATNTTMYPFMGKVTIHGSGTPGLRDSETPRLQDSRTLRLQDSLGVSEAPGRC